MEQPLDPFALPRVLAGIEEEFGKIAEAGKRILRAIVNAACHQVRSAESSLLVPAEGGAELEFLVSVNPLLEKDHFKVPIADSIAGAVFTTGQMISVADVSEEMGDRHYPRIDEQTGMRTQAYTAVPVVRGEQPVGVLTFVNRPLGLQGEPFSSEDLIAAQSFAETLSIALSYHQTLERANRSAGLNLRGLVESPDSAVNYAEAPYADQIQDRISLMGEEEKAFVLEWLDLFVQYRMPLDWDREQGED
jgi:GAF domain-containing protein